MGDPHSIINYGDNDRSFQGSGWNDFWDIYAAQEPILRALWLGLVLGVPFGAKKEANTK